jgi:hypothetical protein
VITGSETIMHDRLRERIGRVDPRMAVLVEALGNRRVLREDLLADLGHLVRRASLPPAGLRTAAPAEAKRRIVQHVDSKWL